MRLQEVLFIGLRMCFVGIGMVMLMGCDLLMTLLNDESDNSDDKFEIVLSEGKVSFIYDDNDEEIPITRSAKIQFEVAVGTTVTYEVYQRKTVDTQDDFDLVTQEEYVVQSSLDTIDLGSEIQKGDVISIKAKAKLDDTTAIAELRFIFSESGFIFDVLHSADLADLADLEPEEPPNEEDMNSEEGLPYYTVKWIEDEDDPDLAGKINLVVRASEGMDFNFILVKNDDEETITTTPTLSSPRANGKKQTLSVSVPNTNEGGNNLFTPDNQDTYTLEVEATYTDDDDEEQNKTIKKKMRYKALPVAD